MWNEKGELFLKHSVLLLLLLLIIVIIIVVIIITSYSKYR